MAENPAEPEWFDSETGRVLMSHGEMLPVVSWFRYGKRTEDPSEATHCVAGPDSDGWWYTITVGQVRVRLQ